MTMGTTGLHWHAYHWAGDSAQLDKADGVRKTPVGGDSGPFMASLFPPFRTCDWLLKPRDRSAGTHTDVEAAVEWIAARYDDAAPSFHRPDQEAKIGRDLRLKNAADLLPRGVDVQWGFWLRGGRFLTVGVICCPNIHAPTYRCPTGRR